MSGWIESRSLRVTRGGSWGIVPLFARVAYRGSNPPRNSYDTRGFRLLRRVS